MDEAISSQNRLMSTRAQVVGDEIVFNPKALSQQPYIGNTVVVVRTAYENHEGWCPNFSSGAFRRVAQALIYRFYRMLSTHHARRRRFSQINLIAIRSSMAQLIT
jgi:hypothetical protein